MGLNQSYVFDFAKFFASRTPHLNQIDIFETEFEEPTESYRKPEINLAAIEMLMILGNEKFAPQQPKAATRYVFRPKQLPTIAEEEHESKNPSTHPAVLDENCLDTAKRLNRQYPGKVALLNMANRQTIGGDVFNGTFAQEERLMVVSDLAGSLLLYGHQMKGFQDKDQHGKYRPYYGKDSFNQTDVLYSSNIIFREHNKDLAFHTLDEKEHCPINFITSACLRYKPKAKQFYESHMSGGQRIFKSYTQEEAKNILYSTIYNQISTAIVTGNQAIVLSAFGCGAFENDPNIIGAIYKDILSLPEFFGKLEVTFAIFKDKKNKNFETFQEIFAKPLVKLNLDETATIYSYMSMSPPTKLANNKEEKPQAAANQSNSNLSNIAATAATLSLLALGFRQYFKSKPKVKDIEKASTNIRSKL